MIDPGPVNLAAHKNAQKAKPVGVVIYLLYLVLYVKTCTEQQRFINWKINIEMRDAYQNNKSNAVLFKS